MRAVFEDEAGAAQILTSRPTGGNLGPIEVAAGSDGTAAVVWSSYSGSSLPAEENELLAAVREPGGRLGDPIVLEGDASVEALDVAVGADGTVEIAYAGTTAARSDTSRGDDAVTELVHVRRPPGAAFTPPQVVTPDLDTAPFVLQLAAASDGGGSRIVYDKDSQVIAAARDRTGAWATPQRLASGESVGVGLIATADGGAGLLLRTDGTLSYWRARPFSSFGRDRRLARDRGGWRVSGAALGASRNGGVIVGWIETYGQLTSFGDSCDQCHSRVLAAVGPPGEELEDPSVVSPLGPAIDKTFIAVGLHTSGKPAAAWTQIEEPSQQPKRLVVAFGSIRPVKSPPLDREPPRVHVSAKKATLRAALRGAAMPIRVRCDERCGIRVAIADVKIETEKEESFPEPEFGSTRAALSSGKAATLPIRLAKRRRLLRNRIAHGSIRIRVIATDAAGNVSRSSHRFR